MCRPCRELILGSPAGLSIQDHRYSGPIQNLPTLLLSSIYYNFMQAHLCVCAHACMRVYVCVLQSVFIIPFRFQIALHFFLLHHG